MIVTLIIFLLSMSAVTIPVGNPDIHQQQQMLDAVNAIREQGCNCGKKYMAPAPKVTWNGLLYESALAQAEDMYKHDYIKHFSTTGLNIGERMDQVGYNWKVAGENLGRGQDTFDEILKDWLKSSSHCMMLMNPKVDEMAIARVNNYWVQHFGRQNR